MHWATAKMRIVSLEADNACSLATWCCRVGLSACNTIPDQADLTHVNTRDIIRNIRCETKDALLAYSKTHWINRIAIGYGFQFQAVEINSVTASGEIVVPISHGTFTLAGLKLGSTRTQDVTKAIDLAEPLGNLRDLDCGNVPLTQNLRYPILGQIGTAKAIEEFVEFVDLPGVNGGKYVRTLKFTIKFVAGANPSVSIIPVPGNKRDGSLDLGADREDEHQLILTLEPPAPGTAKGKGVARMVPPGASSTEKALRRLDTERSLNINKEILDRIRK